MTTAAPVEHPTPPTDLTLLAGVGGIPQANVEWVLAGRLTLTSETHLGGQADPLNPYGAIDLLLDRDPRTLLPRLRLTTLLGLLRHRLLNSLDGYGQARDAAPTPPTAEHIESLFGSITGSSPITGADIELHPPTQVGVLLRPHNHVDPHTGASKPGAYWYSEHLPADTTGLLQLRIRTTPEAEADLLTLLTRAVAGLDPDSGDAIRVGTRTRTGQGEILVNQWVARRYDLTSLEGWTAVNVPSWTEHADSLDAETSTSTHSRLDAAVIAADPALTDTLTDWHEQHPDQRVFDTLTVTVRIGQQTDPEQPDGHTIRPGLVRVGDIPGPRSGDAELVHRTTPRVRGGTIEFVPVLGVASLLAVLKTTAIRAAGVTANTAAAQLWCARWWGSDPGDPGPATPARITATDAALQDARGITHGRSSIDTLFGDAADTHLFSETLYAGGESTLTLTVRNPDDAIRGQLLVLICDLASWSPIPIGGGGHGAFTATAATWISHTPGVGSTVDWLALLTDPDHPARGEATRWMRAYRTALHGQETS